MHFRPRLLCGGDCIHLRMETPLCGRSGGHAGTAPTASFEWIAHGRLMPFWGLRIGGWFRLGGLRVNGYFICVGLRGKILRSVVGAVPVCPPVLPHKGASIVKIPAHNAVYFWYGNAAARTFGRARRRRPYDFVWVGNDVGERKYNPRCG